MPSIILFPVYKQDIVNEKSITSALWFATILILQR